MPKKKISKDEVVIGRIDEAIQKLKDKDFTLYFFVVDSRNIPNGSMRYTYQLAKEFYDKGYNVKMIYQLDNEYSEEEIKAIEGKNGYVDERRRFVGVGRWMGESFASLPHMNIQKEQWVVGPYDFLFVNEAFSSFMYEVGKNKIPCMKYAILQNYAYLTEFIPIGQQWANYGIDRVIATNKHVAELTEQVFPYIKGHTHVIPPYIPAYFRKPVVAKNLIVNIIANNQSDTNRIVKTFYWKYPEYSFVTFRDVRQYPMADFAKMMQDSCITVWVDDKTPFGYSALEAMRCGNIIIGKIPEDIPEWMSDNNGLWFQNIKDAPEIISKVVKAWMNDAMPEEILTAMEETNKKYTYTEYEGNVKKLAEDIIEERISEFEGIKKNIQDGNINAVDEDQDKKNNAEE